MKRSHIKALATGGVIAALYAALTLISALAGLAIGPIEVRPAEALCILPAFTPAAVPGLTVGCLLGNLLCGASLLDVCFGTLSTLLGALGTRALRKYGARALWPPIVSNTLIIPPLLFFVYGFQSAGLPFLYLSIFLGELLCAGGLGALLRIKLLPLKEKLK